MSSEEEVSQESSETSASFEVQVPDAGKDAVTAATKNSKLTDQINDGNVKGQVGGGDVKCKAKKTKAANPLVRKLKSRQRKSLSTLKMYTSDVLA